MKFRNLSDFLVKSFSGLVASFIFFNVHIFLLKYIDEFDNFQFDTLAYSGFFIGATIFAITKIVKKNNLKNYPKFLISIFFTSIFLILLSIFFLIGENTILSGIFFSIFYAVFIMVGVDIFSRSNLLFFNKIKSIIGAAIGGATAGIFISMVFALDIRFAVDEGFFLLTVFSLSLFGIIIGGFIFMVTTIQNLFSKNRVNLISKKQILTSKKKIAILFFIGFILFIFTSFKYWDTLNLNDETVLHTVENNKKIFTCGKINNESDQRSFLYNKEILIDYLKSKPEQNIDILFYLYYLNSTEQNALKFKQALLDEAINKKFVGISNSVKAWQFQVMHRAYYFDLATDKNKELFTPTETNIILDWFKEINEYAYKITWVSYAYGFINKKSPEGPYENQEIGIGLLSILSEILKEKYPDLAKRNMDYVAQYGIGWKHNFRNPDDQIVYAQQAWQKNAFMMAKYGGQDEYLRNENSRDSFEWVMLQWPPNGMAPAYDVPVDWTPFDTMILGASLHDDGNYLWVAEKMFKNELENKDRKIDLILGLEYFENLPQVKTPENGTCYIEGTTGIGLKPKRLMPDKVVLRDGWNDDSLFALLNLRFSGWHSYKATNSFISIMYGNPFVVEKLDLERHDWLPKGKADHRDKKIDRTYLNGLILETKGLQEIIYKITGHGSKWHQDPPMFAEKSFFYTTETVDFIKTKISNWHGWDHNRISILVKDGFIVVFDNAGGRDSRIVGFTWNLKGDSIFSTNSVRLEQSPYTMNVYYPHLEEKFRVSFHNTTEKYLPAGEIHDPDFTLFLLAENEKEIISSTVFIPERDKNYQVVKINTKKNTDDESFSEAIGVKIISIDSTDLIGSNFGLGDYQYENINTDADAFHVKSTSDVIKISFGKANYFEILFDKEPTLIELNGKKLTYMKEWTYIKNKIHISNLKTSGNIMITFN